MDKWKKDQQKLHLDSRKIKESRKASMDYSDIKPRLNTMVFPKDQTELLNAIEQQKQNNLLAAQNIFN
jgi:hypothetical protein